MTKVTELRTKEPALRALVIQAARDCGMDVVDDEYSLLPFLERIYNLAYKAGEKAMQERAAKVCDGASFYEDDPQGYAHQCATAIRVLNIGEDNDK